MRRVFLDRSEIPGLLRGALAGDATCYRRILGARRGGRYGALLAGVAALVAIAPTGMPAALLIHAGLSLVGHFAARGAGLGPRQYQRVVLWTLPIPLALAAPLRLAGAESLPAILAVAVAHGLLWNGLRRGLGPVSES